MRVIVSLSLELADIRVRGAVAVPNAVISNRPWIKYVSAEDS